jgi:hypothetical protein
LNFLLIFLAGLIVSVALIAIWLVVNMRWISQNTDRDRFFSKPLSERIAFRNKVEGKARVISVIFAGLRKVGLRLPVTNYKGVKVPPVCTPDTMQYAEEYQPEPCDIFIATQMKCGTTWMQQIVFEILSRGAGDLSDAGYKHLYCVSPWIESAGSVSLTDAPLIGPNSNRIVKTHLAADLCPYAPTAKYIYVARHPGACLASAIDFVTMLLGYNVIRADEFVDWFCSDDMWWGNWAKHVASWWQLSEQQENVFFVHYEELLTAPEAKIAEIALFLGVTLTPAELARVVEKSSYQYMKDNEYLFEMSPPMPFDVGGGTYFVKGTKDRARDISDADRARVAAFCREALSGSDYPLAKYYPDVAVST